MSKEKSVTKPGKVLSIISYAIAGFLFLALIGVVDMKAILNYIYATPLLLVIIVGLPTVIGLLSSGISGLFTHYIGMVILGTTAHIVASSAILKILSIVFFVMKGTGLWDFIFKKKKPVGTGSYVVYDSRDENGLTMEQKHYIMGEIDARSGLPPQNGSDAYMSGYNENCNI